MIKITELRTEYKLNPIGMDEFHPRFSYALAGADVIQSSRRIRVKDENGRTAWDSGIVKTGESLQIEYAGETLQPFTRYYWSVETELDNGETVSSGEEAFFETGFLDTPWQGKWIYGKTGIGPYRPAVRLAQEFEVKKAVKKARLYSTALGLYTAFINGGEITEDCLTPGWTQYNKRVQYQAYDVKAHLIPGRNVLASLVGNGWFCSTISYVNVPDYKLGYGQHPLFCAELHIEYEDGEQQCIVTDKNWNSYFVYPALLTNDIYLGETYDATFDDKAWKFNLKFAPEYELCRLKAVEEKHPAEIVWQSGAPVRVVERRKPVSVTRHPAGTWIVDFGANIAGRERIQIPGNRPGAVIVIRHGEILNPDGTLYRHSLQFAEATTTITCGREAMSYHPRFTYYGFRYLEISGWRGELTKDMIEAEILSSDLPQTGNFSCSDELVNQLFQNILCSQRGNFIDVPTDCPQRCERFGWTGDIQVFAGVATYNLFAPEFFTKWIYDLDASRGGSNQLFPGLAPNPAWQYGDYGFSAGWSDAGFICPWQQFVKYGDMRLAERTFDAMTHNLDYLEKTAGEIYLVSGTIGDHLAPDSAHKTGNEFIATAYFAMSCRLVSQIAASIGKNQAQQKYSSLSEKVKNALAKKYFTAAGELTDRTQTAAALAIVFELCPDETAKRKAGDFLRNDIIARDYHLATGFLGTPLLLKALSMTGQTALAYRLLEQTTCPSWLFPVTMGATSTWEHWDSMDENGKPFDPMMNSFNHYAFGAVGEWFYENICGIRPAGVAPGERAFKHFILAPEPGGSLTHAEAAYQSMYGNIESAWKLDGNEMEWRFTVPPNTSATLVFPAKDEIPGLAETAGITHTENGWTARPGRYCFRFIV